MTIRRLLIASLVLLLLLGGSLPVYVQAAYDDTQAQDTMHIVLPVDSSTYILTNYSKVESFTVNNNTINFTMLAGSTLELASTDKKNFSYTSSANSACVVEMTCGGYSIITTKCTDSSTITVTPLSTTCTAGSGSGSTSGSGSSGSSSPSTSSPPPAPTTPTPVVTPTPTTPALTLSTPAAPTTPSTLSSPGIFTPKTTFTQLLKLGSSGNSVTQLQQILQNLGFFPANIKPTGTFGPVTVQAVKKFQIDQGISPVGYLGPATREALNSNGENASISSPAPAEAIKTVKFTFTQLLKLGSSGNSVTQLQQILQNLGFFPANIKPTGTFGPVTVQAVKKFQIDQGISPVGYLGPATREALNAIK